MTTDPLSALLSVLRGALKGRVLARGDAEYDDARLTYFGGFDRYPAAIARVADANDVAQVITLARETGRPLAVRGGGHSNAGHGVVEGGLVIDFAQMKRIAIDVPSRTAWAEAGVIAGDFSKAAGQHGLAIGFGDGYLVGIAGLTLGGGLNLLSRKYGLTIDGLLAAEIVTADGNILTVDDQSHPDLFWAIRGGGGNFGAVTRLRYQLFPVARVIGGVLMLPGTPRALSDLIAELQAAPDELTAIVNLMNAFPVPEIQDAYHGKILAQTNLVHCGPLAEGQRAVERLRAIATPASDTVREMDYPAIFPPQVPSRPVVAEYAYFTDAIDVSTARTMLEHLEASTSRVRVAQIRVLGGAVSRVANDATAYAFRDRPIQLTLAAMFPDGAELPKHQAWIDRFKSALPAHRPGVYVNFMKDEGPARVREAYPSPTWERLVTIKRRYDPSNLFRLNQNITP